MLPGRTTEHQEICKDCAGITTNLTCAVCGEEAERYRGGTCIRCVLKSDLTGLLRPLDPPDSRLYRLVRVLCEVDRPESIYTWMRGQAAHSLLARIGNRELALTPEAFDALPKSRAVEHLRAILSHHGMMLDPVDRDLARFDQWIADKLDKLESVSPNVRSPIERFARWHHQARLRGEVENSSNMNYATRSAKQEITEASKFLTWLWCDHGLAYAEANQAHVDEYLAEGPSTRRHLRNFVRYQTKNTAAVGLNVPRRYAETTPLLPQSVRVQYIKTLLEAEDANTAARLAGLLFLLYAIPIGYLSAMTLDQIDLGPLGPTILLGTDPSPIPDELVPLVWEQMQGNEARQTTNTDTPWLFPGMRAGKHITPDRLMESIRSIGIEIQGARNATLRARVEEMPVSALSMMLTYTRSTLTRHAVANGVGWEQYTAAKSPNVPHWGNRPPRP